MCIPFHITHRLKQLAFLGAGGESLILKVIIQLMWEESDSAGEKKDTEPTLMISHLHFTGHDTKLHLHTKLHLFSYHSLTFKHT